MEENTSNDIKIANNDTENTHGDVSGEVENTPLITPGPGLVGQSYSIEEIISKCMLDELGNNRGYFTLQDWKTTLMFRPSEHWTEDQAEQTLYQLLEEGKVLKLGDDKYQPVHKKTS